MLAGREFRSTETQQSDKIYEIMEEFSVMLQKETCAECAMALRRFIGHMDGVESVETDERGRLTVYFDAAMISSEELYKITKENIEKLGYHIEGPQGL